MRMPQRNAHHLDDKVVIVRRRENHNGKTTSGMTISSSMGLGLLPSTTFPDSTAPFHLHVLKLQLLFKIVSLPLSDQTCAVNGFGSAAPLSFWVFLRRRVSAAT
jgi:hypothetical protein